MKIRCKKCGRIIDLKTRTIIEYYLKGGIVKCVHCLYDNKNIREEEEEGLYQELYGWDCDSLLVFNKDIVEVLE